MKRKIIKPSPFLPTKGKMSTTPWVKYGVLRIHKKLPNNSYITYDQKFDLDVKSIKMGKDVISDVLQCKNNAAYGLFLLIQRKINYESTIVNLAVQDVATELGYKPSTIYNAIAALIKLNIISRADNAGNFHINPKKLFVGNLYELYGQYKGLTTEMGCFSEKWI